MQDRDIIELYFARDERAIAQSSDKYGSYCFGIAHNILHNRQDAEECVNDTWARAWNAIPPACPKLLGQFLGGITRHISLDRYRRNQKRYETTVALEELQEVLASDVDVTTEVEQCAMIEAIGRFLWALPERESNIFIRRYYHFDGVRDIAKRYGLTEANVKKILSRTRGKLREYLEKEGYTV